MQSVIFGYPKKNAHKDNCIGMNLARKSLEIYKVRCVCWTTICLSWMHYLVSKQKFFYVVNGS